MPRICLVTPSHPASNPRLVKEADALHAAGHQVVVVAGRYFPPLDSFDDTLLAAAPWTCRRIDYVNGPRALLGKVLRRSARRLISARRPPSLALARHAHHPAISLLAAAATRERADLYIGHCLAGLAAAGLAATRTRATLGFDAEDFHSAETTAAETDPVEIATIRRLESDLLPRCRHLTAASPRIGEAYSLLYGVPRPATILNVFPLAEAPPSPVAPERPGGLPLLYWFSQTIGPGRGLEQLIHVLGLLRTRCALRLRGIPASGFPDALLTLARAAGFHGPIEFAPIGPPSEMARLAAGADLGLSLEQRHPLNRDLCLTNKIFTYLLAGVPVALTHTSAQVALATELGPAALLADVGKPAALAARLDTWLADEPAQSAARAAAWRLAQTRYNWDRARHDLVASVARALPAPKT